MPPAGRRLELYCSDCGAWEECGPAEMLGRLQQLGMFRRAAEPQLEVLIELFLKKTSRFRCPQCGRAGLQVREATDVSWHEARYCSACGQKIPQERVELFPNVDLCTACQQAEDTAGGPVAEYCPRCGNVMTMRAVHGRGITRYSLVCPHCRS